MKATLVHGRIPAGHCPASEGVFAVILNSEGLRIKVTGLADLRLEEIDFQLEPGCTDKLLVGLLNPYPLPRRCSICVLADDSVSGCLEFGKTIPRVVPGDAHALDMAF